MGDGGREQLCARRFAWWVVSVVTVVCVVSSCSTGDRRHDAAAPAPHTPTTSSSAPISAPVPTRAPEQSSTPTDTAGLAERLDAALATLADRHATGSEIREAGEFQQLAVRTLALGSARFRRDA